MCGRTETDECGHSKRGTQARRDVRRDRQLFVGQHLAAWTEDFLITFTVPQELRPLLRAHPAECYRAMFVAAATLRELAQNPKHVGSDKL